MRIKLFIALAFFLVDCLSSQSEVTEKSILIKNGQVELPGTLSYTKDSKKLIIWIHGSGNIDGNGNQGTQVKANYIKQFRDEINKKNIAFFSYDKRTSNSKNAAFLKGVIFDDFVNDAKKVITHLKKEKQFEEIILIGHSQGSLAAMLASEGVQKYISLAGLSESVDKTIIKQVSVQSAELGKTTENHFNELKETGDIKEVNPMLASIFAKPNFPFLKNWMSYDPKKEIGKLKVPTLIVNGTKDIQVSVDDAKALNAANKKSEIKIIKNMNHVLKHIEKDSDNMNSYYSPDFKISSELVKTITEFVKK